MISLVANTAVSSLPSAETIKKPHTTRTFVAQLGYYIYIGGGAIPIRCTLKIELFYHV